MKNITVFKNVICIFLISFLTIALTSCATKETTKTIQVQDMIQVQDTIIEEKVSQPVNNQNVLEAVYKQTFSDVESLIADLNTIIRNENFTAWKTYLTQNYIDHFSNRDNLRQISESSDVLRRHRIVLRTLRDYFDYVVVPSRANVRLDNISFIDDNTVRAYMYVDEQPLVLYHLVRIDGNWKIENLRN
ncbi:MAG: hypothetical protein FWC36_10735 [Spirochaetes bacterium]|nr:hypothetical protein [Spirochaetota bacterium]